MKVVAFFSLLIATAVLYADEGNPLLTLREDLIAPAVRVHTLRVYPTGVVTEEHYDISKGSNEQWPSNGTRQVGTLSTKRA